MCTSRGYNTVGVASSQVMAVKLSGCCHRRGAEPSDHAMQVRSLALHKGIFLRSKEELEEAEQLRQACHEALCRTSQRSKDFPDARKQIMYGYGDIRQYCSQLERPTFWGGVQMSILSAEHSLCGLPSRCCHPQCQGCCCDGLGEIDVKPCTCAVPFLRSMPVLEECQCPKRSPPVALGPLSSVLGQNYSLATCAGEVEMMVISKMLKIPIFVYTAADEKAGCALGLPPGEVQASKAKTIQKSATNTQTCTLMDEMHNDAITMIEWAL